jgi:hypothetical protein
VCGQFQQHTERLDGHDLTLQQEQRQTKKKKKKRNNITVSDMADRQAADAYKEEGE